jgi:prenylcysteine alpha-carboxyl methylesterase
MMEGEESLQSFSPELRIEDPSTGNAVSLLPPIILFHGTADYSIPSSARLEYLVFGINDVLHITKIYKWILVQ